MDAASPLSGYDVSGGKKHIMDAFAAAVGLHSPTAPNAVAALQKSLQIAPADGKLSAEQNQQVENGLRCLLQAYVEAAAKEGAPVMEFKGPSGPYSLPLVPQLLDLVLSLCESGHIEGGLVLQLLEDLLEECAICDCKQVFSWIEQRHDTLGKDAILQRGKLILLRACNQLVRRLSKANDLVFCGRILMFLAFLFPIAEKSAVNIKGAFNTANRTHYAADAPHAPLGFDAAFYSAFWGLQHFFSNPPTAAAAAKWPTFSSTLKTVLSVFSAQPLSNSGSSQVTGDLGSFNVKYLTSPNLLSLELKDHNFRRHILLQSLFLLDYLQLTTQSKPDKDKEKEENGDPTHGEIGELQEGVRKLLRSIPPDGEEFLRIVDHVLQREQAWVKWKKDGCPPFERSPATLTAGAGTKGRDVGSGKGRRYLFGNKELDSLFRWADKHPTILTDRESVSVPKLTDFLQPLADDMDPANGIEEEFHHKQDKVFSWRALRLAARQDIDAFNKFSEMGIEGLVPPDMLVEDVRVKLHGKSSAAAGKQKKDGVAAKGLPPPAPQGPTQPMAPVPAAPAASALGSDSTPTAASQDSVSVQAALLICAAPSIGAAPLSGAALRGAGLEDGDARVSRGGTERGTEERGMVEGTGADAETEAASVAGSVVLQGAEGVGAERRSGPDGRGRERGSAGGEGGGIGGGGRECGGGENVSGEVPGSVVSTFGRGTPTDVPSLGDLPAGVPEESIAACGQGTGQGEEEEGKGGEREGVEGGGEGVKQKSGGQGGEWDQQGGGLDLNAASYTVDLNDLPSELAEDAETWQGQGKEGGSRNEDEGREGMKRGEHGEERGGAAEMKGSAGTEQESRIGKEAEGSTDRNTKREYESEEREGKRARLDAVAGANGGAGGSSAGAASGGAAADAGSVLKPVEAEGGPDNVADDEDA